MLFQQLLCVSIEIWQNAKLTLNLNLCMEQINRRRMWTLGHAIFLSNFFRNIDSKILDYYYCFFAEFERTPLLSRINSVILAANVCDKLILKIKYKH